jgi:Chaperone of endosialidase
VVSSARYKRDIRDMDTSSNDLMKLRPVTFRYKDDRQGIKQYGLVAEEVARVYPELVSYDHGKVESVHYLTLTAMLLNELQKWARDNAQQAEQIGRQAEQIQQLAARSDRQAVQNRRLSTQVAQLKSMFEQAMAAGRSGARLAAAFNR